MQNRILPMLLALALLLALLPAGAAEVRAEETRSPLVSNNLEGSSQAALRPGGKDSQPPQLPKPVGMAHAREAGRNRV